MNYENLIFLVNSVESNEVEMNRTFQNQRFWNTKWWNVFRLDLNKYEVNFKFYLNKLNSNDGQQSVNILIQKMFYIVSYSNKYDVTWNVESSSSFL
jgi:hypothetical protein